MVPASVARPRRTSTAKTQEKINASLKAEDMRITDTPSEPKPRVKPNVQPNLKVHKKRRRPVLPASDGGAEEAKPAKSGKRQGSISGTGAGGGDDDVLLGHFISKCVGIQHYRANGVRYNKEPLHLRRDPHNRYDANAVSVRTLAGDQVGHMQRLDALAVARVADDEGTRIRMVAQVETRANQMYTFPMRVSFFGPAIAAGTVARHLAYQAMSANHFGRAAMGGGIRLIEPKRGRGGARSSSRGRGRGRARAAAAHSSGGAPLEHEQPMAQDDDEEEVEFAGERSWEERDAELRKHAILLE
jgi:hypothetical protein